MVLANNPAFREFEANGGAVPDCSTSPGSLGTDRYFKAYCHLTGAIAALTPRPDPQTDTVPTRDAPCPPLLERINEIKRLQTPTPPPSDARQLEKLHAKLRFVLHTSPDPDTALPGSWAPPLDEARVAIIRHDPPARPPRP